MNLYRKVPIFFTAATECCYSCHWLGLLVRTISTRKVFASNVQIAKLARAGRIEAARILFDEMPGRDVVSWNAMVAAYWQNGDMMESKRVFGLMPERNVISWNSMIAGCIENGEVGEAWDFFCNMPERNVASWNAMISGFVRYGKIDEAARLFEEMPRKNVISYTAMTDGYAKDGQVKRAREIFDEMPCKNEVSWVVMISGYIDNDRFEEAKRLFDQMPTKSIMALTTMITGYCKEGKMDHARHLFEKIRHKDLASWNAIISGYVHNRIGEDALELHNQMLETGTRPDHVTLVAVLTACCVLVSLGQGKQAHAIVIKIGLTSDISVCNTLVTMYSKCGSLHDSELVFERIVTPDLVSWNAIIAAYGQHGNYDKAVEMFKDLEQNSIKPDGVTFLSVLSACGHAGKVMESLHLFDSMVKNYGVERKPEHYSCMVDILGRAGKLEMAYKLVKEMPFDADVAVWGALLRGCRVYLNVKLAEVAATRIFELEPRNSGAYIMLSNVYAAAGMWKDVTRIRWLMKENGVKKQPGYSWMEIGDEVHMFLGGDISHPEIDNIHLELETIGSQMMDEDEEILFFNVDRHTE